MDDVMSRGSQGTTLGDRLRLVLQFPVVLSAILFVVMLAVYSYSVPDSFNIVPENRRFFDSDGEFITRQFREGRTFTHNDHLLYHILGKSIFLQGEYIPGVGENPVSSHKAMSVFFGALGVASLFLFGVSLTRRIAPALLSALFIAGSAGYWFFSATIDTYVPSLCFSIVALGLALRCLRHQRVGDYVALGAAVGMAFLFRTDAVLLFVLAPVAFVARHRLLPRLAACVLASVVVGAFGYAVLAHTAYGVAFRDVPKWSIGHKARPESLSTEGAVWGTSRNLSASNLKLSAVNTGIYTVALPGLDGTRNPDAYQVMARIPGGQLMLATYVLFLAFALLVMLRDMLHFFIRGDWAAGIPGLIALLWYFSRVIFYTWWNPYDPFLFAVMSAPALWLVFILYLKGSSRASGGRGGADVARLSVGCALVALVWAYNLAHMILPLRAL